MAFHLGPRMRKVVRYAGFVVFALVTFVFALQLTFPYQTVKRRIEEALAVKYDVSIGAIERGWMPGRMYLDGVTLRTRPSAADLQKTFEIADLKERDKAAALLVSTLYIERLEIDLGLFALLRGVASVDLDAQFGRGSAAGYIRGNVALSRGGTEVQIEGVDLLLQTLPMRELVGLPMSGKLDFEIDLELPSEKLKTGKVGPNWQKAEGDIEISCPSGCTFGDGKTKLKPKLKNARSQAMVEDGIEFGKINVEALSAAVAIKDGRLEVTQFDTRSSDGELKVAVELTLAQDIGESSTAGCLRFMPSQALLKREPKTHGALSTTGAPIGPDQLFHIRLDGKFKEMKRVGAVCQGAGGGAGGRPGTDGAPRRPNLTVHPEEPTAGRVGDVVSPNPPPPPVQPPFDAGVYSDTPLNIPVPLPITTDGTGSAGSGAGSGLGSDVPVPLPPPGAPGAPTTPAAPD